MNTKTWSLFDRNFHRVALNLGTAQNLSEIARPWFKDFRDDVRIETALNDLDKPGFRQRNALNYLGLDLVRTAA